MQKSSRRPPAPRAPLSRERILAVALSVADREGIEALTMRRLGNALGVEAMSLYHHVGGKNDVLDGILDLVLEETSPPAPEGAWDAAVRRSAISVHRALQRHPWASALLMSPSHARPARIRYVEQLLARLRGAGFSAEATYAAYHVLDAHMVGFAFWQSGHSAAGDTEAVATTFADTHSARDFPHIAEHIAQHLAGSPQQGVDAFELGLDLILAGLERMRRGGVAGG